MNKRMISLYLSEELIEWLKEKAQDDNRSLSYYVNEMLQEAKDND